MQSRLDYLRGDRCTVCCSLRNHSCLWRRRFKMCLISVFGVSGTLHRHLEAVITPSHTPAVTSCLWAREKPWRRGTAASSTTGSPSRSCWLTAPGHLTGRKSTTLCCLWPRCDGRREKMKRQALSHTWTHSAVVCEEKSAATHNINWTWQTDFWPSSWGSVQLQELWRDRGSSRVWTCSFSLQVRDNLLSNIFRNHHLLMKTQPLVFLQRGYWIIWWTFPTIPFEFFSLRRRASNSNFRFMSKHIISQQNFMVADWKTERIKLQLIFLSKLDVTCFFIPDLSICIEMDLWAKHL